MHQKSCVLELEKQRASVNSIGSWDSNLNFAIIFLASFGWGMAGGVDEVLNHERKETACNQGLVVIVKTRRGSLRLKFTPVSYRFLCACWVPWPFPQARVDTWDYKEIGQERWKCSQMLNLTAKLRCGYSRCSRCKRLKSCQEASIIVRNENTKHTAILSVTAHQHQPWVLTDFSGGMLQEGAHPSDWGYICCYERKTLHIHLTSWETLCGKAAIPISGSHTIFPLSSQTLQSCRCIHQMTFMREVKPPALGRLR